MKQLTLAWYDRLTFFAEQERYYSYAGDLDNIVELSEADRPKYWVVSDGGSRHQLVRENGRLLTPITLLGKKLRFAIFANEGAIWFDDGNSIRNLSTKEVAVTTKTYFFVMKITIANQQDAHPIVYWCKCRPIRGFSDEYGDFVHEPIHEIMSEVNGSEHATWLQRWTTGAAFLNLFMTEIEQWP
jgi:hypothetical protein